MKTILLLSIGLLAACGADPDSLSGGRNKNGASTDPNESAAAALQCMQAPQGRSYVLFDGTKMEQSRVNEGAGVNRARLKPYAVLAGEYQRVIGAVPPSLAKSGGSFDDPPERWFTETDYGGVALHAMFDLSFEGCSTFVKTVPEMAQLPTTDSASNQCSLLMKKAWSRTPNPTEVDACVELATKKVSTETNPARAWSYVCASILSSSQFLTY